MCIVNCHGHNASLNMYHGTQEPKFLCTGPILSTEPNNQKTYSEYSYVYHTAQSCRIAKPSSGQVSCNSRIESATILSFKLRACRIECPNKGLNKEQHNHQAQFDRRELVPCPC